MIGSVQFWNEPNNKSHWAVDLDPEWRRFAATVGPAGAAVAAESPRLRRVLGGLSPIDPDDVRLLASHGALEHVDVVRVYGFPLDWNLWKIEEWPSKLDEIRGVTRLPVWVTEAGASSFGADEVQAFGLRRTAELLVGRTARIHWYRLFDLPRSWPSTTRHRETEGSSYYRHFEPGLIREDGTPRGALERFAAYAPALGICQWFHFVDDRLSEAVRWLRRLGVRHVRTGLSWADSFRPDALAWFDRQMAALEGFDVTLTFGFTPEHLGVEPHHTSPPPFRPAEVLAGMPGETDAHPQTQR